MLKKYTLLRSQKSRVYEMLREAGLEPAEFSWSKETIAESLVVSRLNYREGAFYFQFSSHELNAWCTACPGAYRSLEYSYPRTWEEQEGLFRKWAQCLKREVESPDPWEELAKYRVALGVQVSEETTNEVISASEAEYIGHGLNRLAAVVERELALGQGEAALIRGKLTYLAEAARRQRTRDWVYTALGVCATVAMALSLPPEKTAALWQLLQGELSRFIHLAPAPKSPIAAVRPPVSHAAEPQDSKKPAL